MMSEDLSFEEKLPDEEDFIDPTPRKKREPKAMELLGRDSSREKVMERLGISSEEIKQAQENRVARTEEEYQRQREKGGLNKRDAQKALDVLGHNPSTQKLMNTLGVDESVLEEERLRQIEREETKYIKMRKNSASADKRHAQKALEVLGVDPSQDKVMTTLGMDEEDVAEAKEEQRMEYEGQLERMRSTSLINKKDSGKALRVLGLDPSRSKLMETLGLEDEEVKQAAQELQEEEHFRLIKRSSKELLKGKRHIQKGLKVLGYDPSEAKLEERLGESAEILKHRMSPIMLQRSSTNTYYFLLIGVAATLCVFAYVYSKEASPSKLM